MTDFARRLKKLRLDKNFTQKELATLLNVSQNAVYNWENEKREPSMDMVTKIADALGVSEQELLGFKDEVYAFHKAMEERESLKNVTIENDKGVLDGILISDQKLLNDFHELNLSGKYEAIKRVSELKYIPQYTCDEHLPFD